MKIVKVFLVVLVLAALTITLFPPLDDGGGYTNIDFKHQTDRTIPEVHVEKGISINGIDMSGKTKAEAEASLDEYFEKQAEGILRISMGSSRFSKSYRELGFEWNYEDELNQALILGQSAGTIKKFKALCDMRAGDMDMETTGELSTTGLKNFIHTIAEKCNTSPIDATITREDGAFIVTRGRKGSVVNEEATLALILRETADEFHEELTVDAIVDRTEQKVDYDELMKIKDLLGTCTTNVAGTDDRAWNVHLGSDNINGLLLLPGESASASLLMTERTAENGYKLANQYANGGQELTYGGGICQVSSTLYNALLQAEIQVDERHPHSMCVSYLDPSKDAAISWGTKDMKFTNNLDHPIYVEGYSEDRRCTFNIYGVEYRPETHKAEYVSTVTYQQQEPDIEVYSNEFPVGYRKEEGGSRHAVTESYLEKVIYENGVEVSRTVLHKDHYNGSVKRVIIGTFEAPTAPVETVPGVTAEPVPDTPAETTAAGQ